MSVPFSQLVSGGGIDGASGGCGGNLTKKELPGVGTIWTCWQITTVTAELRYIRVRSESVGPFAALTRSEFTTFRSLNGLPPGAAAP